MMLSDAVIRPTPGDDDKNQDSDRRPWRAVGLPAAAGIALLAAACSGSPPLTAAGSSGFQTALAYAECMRSHGAPNWPDPNSQGQFLKTKANTADFQAPAQAYRACLRLLPNGGQLTTAQQQIISPLMLKFAGCMRTHGITNFPDPTVNAKDVDINRHGLDTSSPAFHAAQQACQEYMTEAQKYMPPD
jgi:hypothetical protein